MHKPLVSVLLPVYKGEKYLKEAIQSILDQTYNNFELLIINDASPDHSKIMIESFDDQRIRYIENEVNLGLIGSLNKGIEASKGKYLARMDQDDISLPDRFEKQIDFLERNPEYVICGMQGQVLNNGKKINVPEKDEQIRALMFFGSPFIHPVVMLRKEALESNNLKYDNIYQHAEDFGLWINLAFTGKMANLSDIGIYYRKHQFQYTEVFNQGMKTASIGAKSEYLNRCKIELSIEENSVFLKLSNREVNYIDELEMVKIADFLKIFYSKVLKSNLDKNYMRNLLYRTWKVLCGERQKMGLSTYLLFLKGPFVFRYFEPKVHLSFIKSHLSF